MLSHMSEEEVRSLIGQAIGEASMCWDPLPGKQVFDSTRASSIVERTAKALLEKGAGAGIFSRVEMSDDQEALDNIRVNAHFFHKDNVSMHPAHRRLFKMIETAAESALEHDGLQKSSSVGKSAGMVKFTERLKGGKADGMVPSQFASRQLAKGKKVEREHTRNGRLATEIAMDHLAETPNYYDKLEAIEKHAMFDGFASEMEKISRGMLRDIGNSIRKTGRSWGKSLKSAPGRTLDAIGDLRNPAKAMKQGWHATWHNPKTSGGTLGRAMFGLGTLASGATAIPKNDPTGRDESRTTRAMRFAGGTALGIAGMKRGVIPSIALGIGGDVAAGAIGRRIDKAKGYRPSTPTQKSEGN
jgi:hypothetical protein